MINGIKKGWIKKPAEKLAKPDLIASSNTSDGLKNLIAKYFYSAPEKIEFVEIDPESWSVKISGKELTAYQVSLVKTRYRFERAYDEYEYHG